MSPKYEGECSNHSRPARRGFDLLLQNNFSNVYEEAVTLDLSILSYAIWKKSKRQRDRKISLSGGGVIGSHGGLKNHRKTFDSFLPGQAGCDAQNITHSYLLR